MILRPRVLHVVFGSVLSVIGILAFATAVGTTAPWFSVAVSMQVYTMSLLGSIVLAAFLASMAGSRAAQLDEIVRSLDLRLAAVPEAMGLPHGREATLADVDSLPPSDAEVDDFLKRIELVPTDSGVAEFEIAGTLVDVSAAITSAKTRRELLKEVIRQRSEALGLRAKLLNAVAGPIGGCLSFVLVAGPFLAGVDAFAIARFQLNTAAVLFLAYGWVCLLAWALFGIGFVTGRGNARPTN